MSATATGTGLKRLQHLGLWVSDVERSVRFYFDILRLRVPRMYHSAWEVGDLVDLARARQRLAEAGALVGASDHGVSLSLYAKDPDGLEFEIFWTVPGGASARTTELDLEGELARRGLALP